MNKTVAITGGRGYIAGFIIAEFLNHGYTVKASLRKIEKFDALKTDLSNFVSKDDLSRLFVFEADLTSEKNWAENFKGTDGVIHVASPLGTGKESVNELRKIAEQGTLNVLNAASKVGVKRIVMTSSQAACTPKISVGNIVLDEMFWSDENNSELDAYRLSKVFSEKAAWAFAKQHQMELTTILPGAVFGKVMNSTNISSNKILLDLINGRMPKAINVPFEISNVLDLATLHRLAFEKKEAIGERFLAASQTIRMPEIAQIYRQKYPLSKTPKKTFCNFTVRILAKFIPSLRALVPMLKRQYTHSTNKATNLLGWVQHTPQKTILEAANSFEKLNLIKNKS